ncbi:hypothetical protein GCM10023159_13720 [Brevibacterium yomogidense]
MATSQTPFGLPRAVHPDLSPAAPTAAEAPVRSATATPVVATAAEVVATGPFKVYSPDATDWTVGIDLRVEDAGLGLTTPTGHQRFSPDRFTVEMSPDGTIVWILGTQVDGTDHPAVTVLMPATADDQRTRLPGVEFADLGEAAHIVHRLTAATAAGRHTRHRFGLQRPGDLGLVIDPMDGEPVLALLRLTDTGMEFRGDGRWEKDSPAQRIAPFTSLMPVTCGAVARFDHLEQSPSMSLSLFRRFVIPGSLRGAPSLPSPAPQSSAPQSSVPQSSGRAPDDSSAPSAPAPARTGGASSAARACAAPERAPASAESTTSALR